MIEIHCYNCGGFIDEPKLVSHRVPPSPHHKEFGAVPTSALCTCNPPVVYGPPEGRSSSPGQQDFPRAAAETQPRPLAPITIQRFVKALDKLKREMDAGTLQQGDYDGRLARIIQELRERGLDADRAAATAALADAVTHGVITSPVQAHIHQRLGLATPMAEPGR